MKLVINPADSVLVEKYEKLNANQKKFAEWLIEEKLIDVDEAINQAAKVKKFDWQGKPRTIKVERMYQVYKARLGGQVSMSELIDFKNALKEYYDHDEAERMMIYIIMIRKGSLDDAFYGYDEHLTYITDFYTSYVRDYSQNKPWNLFACHELGECLISEGFFYLDDCPERLIDFIDPELVAISMITEGSIEYLVNPDWYESEQAIDSEHSVTYFYADLDA